MSDYSKLRFPMIVFRTPKGWTGPKEVEGSFKAHQIPFPIEPGDEAAVQKLEDLQKLILTKY